MSDRSLPERRAWRCFCGTLQHAESDVCDTCHDTYPGEREQSEVTLTTTSAVYFTALSLEAVAEMIRTGALISVRDDSDKRLFLNPAAVRTVTPTPH